MATLPTLCRPKTRGLAALALLLLAALPPAWAALPIQHWVQPSGAQVYLIESPAIPMVDVQIDFDAGSRRDPPDQVGLAGAVAGQFSRGLRAKAGAGTAGPAEAVGMDENQLSDAWADLGASFGASAGADRMSFSLRTLTYPDLLPRAVQLAARQLGAPAFPEHTWRRDRERISASLRESRTRPATIAGKAFAAAVYGTHPYGYDMTEQTLARIGRDDLLAFYGRMVLACRAKVSIVGAVDRARADALAAQLLAQLPQTGCAEQPAVAEVQPLTAEVDRRIAFASSQAHVLIGQPGFRRLDPDFFALTVGNYVLGGGGFVSRLQTEVREKRGLSYSVYSYFAPGLHAGAFTVGLQTRPDQAAQAVEVARDVLARFVTEGPTEAELKAAKDFLVGGFALRIDSNRKLLDNLSSIAWNGLPLDYLDTWTAQVQKISAADVRAAFARKLQPARMATVVVGGAP